MNTALRKALAEAQLTETDVAAHLGVDPKTVRRWLSGQRPYPRHRWALSELLQTAEDSLWPLKRQESQKQAPESDHVQHVYAHRWQVPREAWWDLFGSAEQEIGILVYSGLFIADDAGIMKLLEAQARKGVKVRILLGDASSLSVQRRGLEEQIGGALAARVNNSLILFRALMGVDGVEIRTHSTTLYNSIYLTEKKMIINQHVYGLPASKSPVMEILRKNSSDVSTNYVSSFELAWRASGKVREWEL